MDAATNPISEGDDMSTRIRIFSFLFLILALTACGRMIPIKSVNGSGTVDRELTLDQVKKAINEGAYNAGWIAKDVADGEIVASYRLRAHSVIVTIEYTQDSYEIKYKSSSEMKIQCTEEDWKKSTNIKVSGRHTCPGYADPLYIHGNYELWINSLRESINLALVTAV